MKISISIPEENTVTNHGYGVASFGIVRALQELGHEVPFQDPAAPVELNFSQPDLWKWSSDTSYHIGMTAWESTQIPDNWHQGLESCDELWTPSPLIAEWFEAEGYKVSKVYEHGVNFSRWAPRLRDPAGGRPIKFLHIGEPAPRKGGQLTYDVFSELYGNRPNLANLTIKAFAASSVTSTLNNVTIIKKQMSELEMVKLIHDHDVLIYPSYGEGFGLIPLQAMATGMPVICTDAWAPYKRFLLPELRVSSTLEPSLWSMHNGKIFYPNKHSLASSMIDSVRYFSALRIKSYDLVPRIRQDYDWLKLTENAFSNIVQKFA